jgi:hypothetical protein
MQRIALTMLLASTACAGGVDLTGGDDDATDTRPADARDEAATDGPTDVPVDLWFDVPADDGAGEDGGIVRCDSQAAALGSCLFCDEPLYLGAFWNGRECFELLGCECTGADCGGGFPSLAECEAYHAGCDGALCAATGGQWFPASVGLCGFTCGVPSERDCFAPMDSCRCPPGETFVSGTGCLPAASCEARELCVGSHGAWHPASECYCGFSCGSPSPCAACIDSCDCGPYRNFEAGRGCRFDAVCLTDAEPPYPPPAELCEETGGTWDDCDDGCACGDYHCGVPNLLDPCVMPGCDCGPYASYDAEEGCVWDDACVLREVGEPCMGAGLGHSSCRPGLACCGSCGDTADCSACANPCCGSGDPLCTATGCPASPP